MARRTPQALTPRWRRRVWNESELPFSYELAVFYVLAHLPYFICLWVIIDWHLGFDGFAPKTQQLVAEMMFWLRVSAWLMLGWTIALGVSTVVPWSQRVRHRLPMIAFAVLISAELVFVAHLASDAADKLSYPEPYGQFEFRYDPATQKWFYQP